jgi:hypothetical protein
MESIARIATSLHRTDCPLLMTTALGCIITQNMHWVPQVRIEPFPNVHVGDIPPAAMDAVQVVIDCALQSWKGLSKEWLGLFETILVTSMSAHMMLVPARRREGELLKLMVDGRLAEVTPMGLAVYTSFHKCI